MPYVIQLKQGSEVFYFRGGTGQGSKPVVRSVHWEQVLRIATRFQDPLVAADVAGQLTPQTGEEITVEEVS
jgi:hypothetical protein